MKIKVSLNEKSIKETISRLNKIKKDYAVAYEDFLEDVALWLINKANENLDMSDIGDNVKQDIKNSWEYDRTATGIKITNRSDKAVFVEFGVGMIGAQQPHQNANANGYAYGIGKKIRDDGTWIFNPKSEADIDIQSQYLVQGLEEGHTTAVTRGQPAVMYAYNAIVDIKVGKTLQNLWEKNRKRNLGF